MDKPVLDISQFQPPEKMDYKKIAKQIDGVILRAGYTGYVTGKAATDSAFEKHYLEFTRLKIPIGVYWVVVGNSADMGRREASFLLERIKGKAIELGVWCDTEWIEENKKAVYIPQKNSKQQNTDCVQAFCESVEAAGHSVGIYSAEYWFDNHLIQSRLTHWPWWVANYQEKPKISHVMWQYTSSGKLDGYSGNLDLNKKEVQQLAQPQIYTPILKRKAPISALQDPGTITAGSRYTSGFDVTPRPLGLADGRPSYGHKGIDFAVGKGTPLYALFDGSLWSTWETSGGNIIKLTTSNGLGITYRHLDSYVKKTGSVKKGDLIAYSGNSGGASTGPHLHVDIFDSNKGCHDAYPYVAGIWDQYGKSTGSGSTTTVYADTDQYEYELPSPAYYTVDTESGGQLRVRRSPGTDKDIVRAIDNGSAISVDKRCDLPNGERWARIKAQPWNWICLFNGRSWLVKDAPLPAHRYLFGPGRVYQVLDSIQGYSEPGWQGEYRKIAFKDHPILVVERYDTADGLVFGKTVDNVWYLLYSEKYGWSVRGGWLETDRFDLILDSGTDVKTGSFTELLELMKEYGQGVLRSPTGNNLEVQFERS